VRERQSRHVSPRLLEVNRAKPSFQLDATLKKIEELAGGFTQDALEGAMTFGKRTGPGIAIGKDSGKGKKKEKDSPREGKKQGGGSRGECRRRESPRFSPHGEPFTTVTTAELDCELLVPTPRQVDRAQPETRSSGLLR